MKNSPDLRKKHLEWITKRLLKAQTFFVTFDSEEIQLFEESQGCSGSGRFLGCWPQKG